MSSAPRSGREASWSRASSTSVTASAVACASASVALAATTVTESGPATAGTPVAGSIRWWSRPPGPKRRVSRPDVATPPRSSSSVPAHAARRPRVCDVHAPRPAFRRRAPDGDVAAEIDERPGQPGPGAAHRVERARRGEALADAAEIDRGASLDAGTSASSGRRRCARRHASRRAAWRPARSAARRSGRSRRRSSAGRIVGSNRPRVSVRARSAASSASTSRASTAIQEPAARLSRERSLSASKRESARSQAATSRRAASSARRASVSARPVPRSTATAQIVPMARNDSRCKGGRHVGTTARSAGAAGRTVVDASAGGAGRVGAWRGRCARHQDARVDEPDDRSHEDPGEDQPARPGEVGADVERVVEADREGREARVVQQAPAALADAAAHVEGGREDEHQPAGDDPCGDGHGPPRRRAGHQHADEPEAHDRIDRERAPVQNEHRDGRPHQRLVPAEQRLAAAAAEQSRAQGETERDRDREQRERDEAGGAGDEPGHGHAR